MELKDIAAVSGKPGLYKIMKPTRGGLVLESLIENGQKLVTGPQNRVSLLHEISVYTEQVDVTVPLSEIFNRIHKEFGDNPGVDSKSDPEELKSFLAHIVPDYDRDKVYVSDMKKMVAWYGILAKTAPELLVEPVAEKTEEKPAPSEAAEKVEKAKPAKTKAAEGKGAKKSK